MKYTKEQNFTGKTFYSGKGPTDSAYLITRDDGETLSFHGLKSSSKWDSYKKRILLNQLNEGYWMLGEELGYEIY